MTDIKISDILAVTTAPATTVSPSDPDSSAQLVLKPTAATGTNSFAAINFENTAGSTVATLTSNLDTGNEYVELNAPSEDIRVNAGDNLTLAATNDLVIGGLVWPSTDGSAGQILATDGSGNLIFVDDGNGAEGHVTIGASATEIIKPYVMANVCGSEMLISVSDEVNNKAVMLTVKLVIRPNDTTTFSTVRVGDHIDYSLDVVENGGMANVTIVNNESNQIKVSIKDTVINKY